MLNKTKYIAIFFILFISITTLVSYKLSQKKVEEIFSSTFDVLQNTQQNYSTINNLTGNIKNDYYDLSLSLKLENKHLYQNSAQSSLYNFNINSQNKIKNIDKNYQLSVTGQYLFNSQTLTSNLFQIKKIKSNINELETLEIYLNLIQDNWFNLTLDPKNWLLNLKDLIFKKEYLINNRSKKQLLTALDLSSCSNFWSKNYCLNFSLNTTALRNIYIKNFYDQKRVMSASETELIDNFIKLAHWTGSILISKKDYHPQKISFNISSPFLNINNNTIFNRNKNITFNKPSPQEIINLRDFIKSKNNNINSGSGNTLKTTNLKIENNPKLEKRLNDSLQQTPITGSGGILNQEIKVLDKNINTQQQELLKKHQQMMKQYYENYQKNIDQQQKLYEKNNQLFQKKIDEINEQKKSWQKELSQKISNWFIPQAYATVGEDIREFPFSFNLFDNGTDIYIENTFYKDLMEIYVHTFVMDSYMLLLSFKSNFAYITISSCENTRIKNLQNLALAYLENFRDIVKNAHCFATDPTDCQETEKISSAIDSFFTTEYSDSKYNIFFGNLINDNDNSEYDEITNFIFDNGDTEFDIEWFYDLRNNIPKIISNTNANIKYTKFKEYIETAINYIAYTGSISIRRFSEQNYKKTTPAGKTTSADDKKKVFYCGWADKSKLDEKFADSYDFIPFSDITTINCNTPAYILYAHNQAGVNIDNTDDKIIKENFVGVCLEETITWATFGKTMLNQIQLITGTVSIFREWLTSIATLFNEATSQINSMFQAAFDDTVGNVSNAVGETMLECMENVTKNTNNLPAEEQTRQKSLLRLKCLYRDTDNTDGFSQYQREIINKFLGSLSASGGDSIIKMNIQTNGNLLNKAKLTKDWPASTANFLNLKSENRQAVIYDNTFFKGIVQFKMRLGANKAVSDEVSKKISQINTSIASSVGKTEQVSLNQFYATIEDELGDDVLTDSTSYQAVKKSVKFLYWLEAQFNDWLQNSINKNWLDGTIRSIKAVKETITKK